MAKTCTVAILLFLAGVFSYFGEIHCAQTTIRVPPDHSVIEGNSLTLVCKVFENGTMPSALVMREFGLAGEMNITNNTFPGRVTVLPAELLPNEDNFTVEVQTVFTSVIASDTGMYYCKVFPKGHGVGFDISVLPVASVPAVVTSITNVTDNTGLVLHCNASASFNISTLGSFIPTLAATWKHGFRLITNSTDSDNLVVHSDAMQAQSNNILTVSLNYRLTINPQEPSYHGNYTCQVTLDYLNKGKFQVSSETYLPVWTVPPKPSSSIHVMASLSTVLLSCLISLSHFE